MIVSLCIILKLKIQKYSKKFMYTFFLFGFIRFIRFIEVWIEAGVATNDEQNQKFSFSCPDSDIEFLHESDYMFSSLRYVDITGFVIWKVANFYN